MQRLSRAQLRGVCVDGESLPCNTYMITSESDLQFQIKPRKKSEASTGFEPMTSAISFFWALFVTA